MEGAEEFRRILSSLSSKEGDAIRTQVANGAANACLRVATENTPVGDYSGSLFVDTQNSKIRYASFLKSDGARVTFRVKKVKQGGTLRRNWRLRAAKPRRGTVQAEVFNNTPYGGFVNDGHRTVNNKGETTGWVEGQFFLDKGVEAATAALPGLFEQALQEVKDKYGL